LFVLDCPSFACLRRAEAQVRVQRVIPPDDGTESWTVLADDWAPVAPVELFLAHLTDQGRSPNTSRPAATRPSSRASIRPACGAHRGAPESCSRVLRSNCHL